MSNLIVVDNVSKAFEDPSSNEAKIQALENISLEIQESEFMCLLGPSGCGKSTLLNAIGGFSPVSSGKIKVGGRVIAEPGPDRGMVFQEYALFPWMTVEDNIGFGMQIAKFKKAEISKKTAELLQTFKLQDFRKRFPKDLSGGMRQRVAIARVLAIDSPILLMDEPFGALDALTRRNLQDELLRIWHQYKRTIVFVTHGIEEAIFLADRIAVMTYRPGKIKRIVSIDLPRPRDPTSVEFNRLKKEISELVMEEQDRHEEALLGINKPKKSSSSTAD